MCKYDLALAHRNPADSPFQQVRHAKTGFPVGALFACLMEQVMGINLNPALTWNTAATICDQPGRDPWRSLLRYSQGPSLGVWSDGP